MSNETINKNEVLCHKHQGEFVFFLLVFVFSFDNRFFKVVLSRLLHEAGVQRITDNRLIINLKIVGFVINWQYDKELHHRAVKHGHLTRNKWVDF